MCSLVQNWRDRLQSHSCAIASLTIIDSVDLDKGCGYNCDAITTFDLICVKENPPQITHSFTASTIFETHDTTSAGCSKPHPPVSVGHGCYVRAPRFCNYIKCTILRYMAHTLLIIIVTTLEAVSAKHTTIMQHPRMVGY